MFNNRTTATVLAALRLLRLLQSQIGNFPEAIEDIRTDVGDPLIVDEIDKLCEALNLGTLHVIMAGRTPKQEFYGPFLDKATAESWAKNNLGKFPFVTDRDDIPWKVFPFSASTLE